MGSYLYRFMGLPVHPLVDHFAVVLFPLALIGFLLLLAFRPWRARYGWLMLLTLTAGTGFVLLAKESGEQLARHIGEPKRHADLANFLVISALATWALISVWFVLDRGAALRHRRAERSGAIDADNPAPRSAFRALLAGFAALGAVASLVLVTLVGHTGAQATWASADATPAPSTSPTATTSPTSTTGSTPSTGQTASSSPSATNSGYTLAQIAQHNSQTSCWAAINGNVYDLTQWINQHPGGPGRILAICGTDGSAAFNGQHAGEPEPTSDLSQFKIGVLNS